MASDICVNLGFFWFRWEDLLTRSGSRDNFIEGLTTWFDFVMKLRSSSSGNCSADMAEKEI